MGVFGAIRTADRGGGNVRRCAVFKRGFVLLARLLRRRKRVDGRARGVDTGLEKGRESGTLPLHYEEICPSVC